MVESHGHPLAFAVGKANVHDMVFARRTVTRVTIRGRPRRPRRLGADKGYDADDLRRFLRQRHIQPCLRYRSNHVQPVPRTELRQRRYSQQRWKVERTFAWLNNCRRLDRFMEKKAATYRGFCNLMFIKYYVKKLTK